MEAMPWQRGRDGGKTAEIASAGQKPRGGPCEMEKAPFRSEAVDAFMTRPDPSREAITNSVAAAKNPEQEANVDVAETGNHLQASFIPLP
jgi:hypothetical protein